MDSFPSMWENVGQRYTKKPMEMKPHIPSTGPHLSTKHPSYIYTCFPSYDKISHYEIYRFSSTISVKLG